MSVRRWLPWVLAILAVVLMVLGEVVNQVYGVPHEDIALFLPVFIGGSAMAVVGALVASRTDNRLGWILLAIPASAALAIVPSNLLDAAALGAASFSPTVLGWLELLAGPPFFASLGLLVAVFYLFPTGRIPSRRWRWPWRVYVTAMWITIAGFVFLPTSDETLSKGDALASNPLGIEPLAGVLGLVLQVSGMLIVASALASFLSIVTRYRAADPEQRQQLRWLFLVAGVGATLLVTLLLTVFIGGDVDTGPLATLADVLALALVTDVALGIPAATAIAIFRYHLYDLNVVVRKTIVIATLAVFISAVYIAIVVGVGALAGSSGGEALPVIATAAVALLFQPARQRAHRFANHLVYGVRATPYEVIAGFSSRMSGTVSTDDVLPEMAEAAGRGAGAASAIVSVHLPGGREAVERWAGEVAPALGPKSVFPVIYRGEPIGTLTVTKPASEPLTRAEHDLLSALAAHAGLALHNVRLTEELQIRLRELDEQAAALRVSRERLVTARDAQRRGLQRDLHEGPERQLIAIGHRLAEAGTGDAGRATAILDEALASANQTLEGLRDLARGIFPPLLADQGIVAALEAHIRKVGANARVVPTDGFERLRFDADVEACVYFCCLQTIQNVTRHAGNAASTVTLATDDDAVLVTIADEGQGFDAASTPAGMGLAIVRDRVDALEGSLAVQSSSGAGTTITIRIPGSDLGRASS